MPIPGRWPRRIRIGLFGLANLALLAITLPPSRVVPGAGLADDKLEHGLGWFALTAAGLALSPRRPRAVTLFALAMGAAVEGLQAITPWSREGDWRDFVADACGVALAAIAALILRRRGAAGRR